MTGPSDSFVGVGGFSLPGHNQAASSPWWGRDYRYGRDADRKIGGPRYLAPKDKWRNASRPSEANGHAKRQKSKPQRMPTSLRPESIVVAPSDSNRSRPTTSQWREWKQQSPATLGSAQARSEPPSRANAHRCKHTPRETAHQRHSHPLLLRQGKSEDSHETLHMLFCPSRHPVEAWRVGGKVQEHEAARQPARSYETRPINPYIARRSPDSVNSPCKAAEERRHRAPPHYPLDPFSAPQGCSRCRTRTFNRV